MTDDRIDAENEATESAVVDEARVPEGTSYIQAPKLMRIASMTRAMLEEVRQAPVDDPGRRRLVEVYERSLEEMEDVLSEDLREELRDIFIPISSESASESELRIAQAQLVGWLEGLFAGIQASLLSQQAAAAHQLQEMRMRAIEAQSRSGRSEAPGQYL